MLTIGELSQQAGASVRSLRHYEQCGLLAAKRRENGYRYFEPAAVEFVQRIRILMRNGFTVEEIRPVVSTLTPRPSLREACADVIAPYGGKLGEPDECIAALQAVRNSAAERLAFLEMAESSTCVKDRRGEERAHRRHGFRQFLFDEPGFETAQAPFDEQAGETACEDDGADIVQDAIAIRLNMARIDQLEAAPSVFHRLVIHGAAAVRPFHGDRLSPFRQELGRLFRHVLDRDDLGDHLLRQDFPPGGEDVFRFAGTDHSWRAVLVELVRKEDPVVRRQHEGEAEYPRRSRTE